MEQINEREFFADTRIPHQQWLQGELLNSQLSYWREQIGDGFPLLALPTNHARLVGQTVRTKTLTFALPLPLSESLRTLSRAEEATLFMTLLAAFQLLLHRYTGEDDFIIGTNRIAGGFRNILLLRADTDADPTFREFLRRVRRVVFGAYAHAELPYEQLLDELQPGQATNDGLLVPVMFGMKDAQMPPEKVEDLTGGDSHNETANIDLALLMEDAVHGVRGSFQYNADLFEDVTIARMAGHLEMLLSGIVANPELHISMLPLLREEERHQLLVEWNDTGTDYPNDCCLHQLFEANEKKRPNAVALMFKEKQVTYSELNRCANQLAHHLRSLGVGAEVRVGICVERSVEMVVAILGTLKAGGAYVPLDPTYPRERLAFMLDDAKVSVLLTQQRLVEGLPQHGATVVCLDTGCEAICCESEDNPRSEVSAENLAYVIYTSGSTGRPKGITLRHSGVVNNLVDLNRRFEIGSEDRILAISSPSFDMCVYEVLGTLAAGATIVMPDASVAKDPSHWAKLIVDHLVTVWNSAPQLLEMLVSHIEDRPELRPRFLRAAILGGDWVPVTLPARLKALAENVKVIVLGGATEASIHSIIYPVEKADPSWRSIPYGRPMANQQAYILDPYLQAVPVGVPGELHLGGIGLARGYFDRPNLTAEKFIPNPFGQQPGERLYKTGDLARYGLDGNIELIGRMDYQVKIRGHRIELSEIVAALKQHPAIQEAVVVVREDQPGNKRLVAYVVCDLTSDKPTQSELRNTLKKQLPDYMIPPVIVVLDKMPLSPNGKVDRRALPAPESVRPQAYVPPRTGLEQLLCDIWKGVLAIEQIGVHDNFFELGGSSIQGAAFINKLQEKLAEIIHLVAIFDAPTVADFASYLHKHYPDGVSRMCASESFQGSEDDIVATTQIRKIDASRAEQMRELLRRRNVPR